MPATDAVRAPSPHPSPPSATADDLNDLPDLNYESDSEDEDFSGSDDGTTSDEDTGLQIPHDEIVSILPSKTVPEPAAEKRRKRRRSKRHAEKSRSKKTKCPRTAGFTDDASTSTAAAEPSQRPSTTRKGAVAPIHHFFQLVPNAADGSPGALGDKHYKCLHGDHRIIMIAKSLKGNNSKLVYELKRASPLMHRLWEVLKRKTGPPTVNELMVASGRQDPSILNLDLATNVEDLTMGADNHLNESFDQAMFEQLIGEWLVATDKPFTEVSGPEYQHMMEYARHCPTPLVIPSSVTMKTRIVTHAERATLGIRDMIKELESKVSLSLDMWSSSNGYTFLAIVMHYVTNDWKLGELLIDFCELVGEHSGANISAAVWKTIEFYGLKLKLLAITMDNATNNDTMMEDLAMRFEQEGIPFDAKRSRMRCVPHSVHLSAKEMLGILEGAPRQTASSAGPDGYQETVTESTTRARDDEVAQEQDQYSTEPGGEALSSISGALTKLRKIIVAVRSSPQRRKRWLDTVELSLRKTEAELREAAMMLILDVKTRWSSTHQMLRRAFQYKKQISDYIAQEPELMEFDLTAVDWQAIELISRWLYLFREATTQMSATQHNTLASVHGIFIGLQEEVKRQLLNLPITTPPELRKALLSAYCKLSDYFFMIDQSPFYLWACLLDPRISYDGLRKEAAERDDDGYLADINRAKNSLSDYFQDNYLGNDGTSTFPTDMFEPYPTQVDFTMQTPRKSFDFLKRYKDDTPVKSVDELDTYFRSRRAKWDKQGEPLVWWYANRDRYPMLSRLARDLLTIPGSSVAVERVFCSGRDTISLRRASLKPETIRTLMLYKHQLILRRRELDHLSVTSRIEIRA